MSDFTPIPVTPSGLALVVASAPATPKACDKLKKLWRQQADIHLSMMLRNPVPKGTTYE